MKGNTGPYGVRDDFGYRAGEDALGFTREEGELWDKAREPEDREAVMRQRD